MKKGARITIWRFGALLAVLALLFGTWYYVDIWAPNREWQRTETWWANASTNEIRERCHDIISDRASAPHDEFLHLGRIGNADSVPLLIQYLEWQNSDEDDVGDCTLGHCADALRSLTGEDFGYSPSRWKDW